MDEPRPQKATNMLIEDLSNVSSRLRVRRQRAGSPLRGSTKFQRVPQPPSDLVFSEPSRDQIRAMKPNMFGFCDGIGLLLRNALCEICMRHDFVKVGQEVLMEM
jgi:hypothetical protein